MTNDLVTIELQRKDGEQIFINPYRVAEFADILEQTVKAALLTSEAGLEPVAYLGSVRTGSLLLAYKIFLARPGVREKREMIETTLLAMDALIYAYSAIGWAGEQLKLLVPQAPTAPYSHQLTVPLPPEMTTGIDRQLQKLAKVSIDAECDTCKITLPDCGTYVMDFDNIRSAAVLGRLAPRWELPPLTQNNKLILQDEKLKGIWKRPDGADEEVELIRGILETHADVAPVLVKWNSKRAAIPRTDFHVTGSLSYIQTAKFKPTDLVPATLQEIPFLLVVDGVYAAE